MNLLKNVLGTEHGFIGIALILGATTLCALGIMPLEKWESYTQVIFATFAGAHAVITGANALANRSTSTTSVETTSITTRPPTIGDIAVAAEMRARAAIETPEPPKAA